MPLARLLQPKALFRLDQWAQTAAVTDYFGLEPGQLNDDRLGRALERLAAHSDKVQPALVLAAIQRFKLNVTQVHYDITSVELFGAYEIEVAEGKTPPTPLPAYGRTKSGRKNIKQVQLGLNVTGDGAVPISHLPLDGNAGEAPTHLENLRRLRALLPTNKLLGRIPISRTQIFGISRIMRLIPWRVQLWNSFLVGSSASQFGRLGI